MINNRKTKMFSTVLLVDDSEVDLRLSANIIDTVGLCEQVVQRTNVIDAVNYLQECASKNQPFPDIIMLDVNMPMLDGEDFLDVFDLFEPVLKKNSHLIILTSETSKLEKFRKHPFVDYILEKPIGFEELEKALDKIQKKRLQRIGQWLQEINGN